MTRPNFCPECGKPLQADLVFPFSVGPKDYADGGYTAICRSEEDGYCGQSDIYPSDEQRGRYSEEEKRERFAAAVERENGRLDKLVDTIALYRMEYQDRASAHLQAMSEDEIRAFIARCDEDARNCHGFESWTVEVKRWAEAELGMRWHKENMEKLGNPDCYCLYHACDAKDCVAQHGD